LRVGDALQVASRITVPSGSVQSGLPKIVTSPGTTRIRFPDPGVISPTHPQSAPDAAHRDTFGFAYANELARTFMLGKDRGVLPVGSIIVREKLSTETAGSPEVLVVMVKRQKNFNTRANDWEFLTVSGDMNTIVKREKAGKCRACHAAEAKNDFIFRYSAP
jgi:Cytochrome P460